jgi:hypothetical protein
MRFYQRVIGVVNIDQNIRVCKWWIGPRCQSFDYILLLIFTNPAKELGVCVFLTKWGARSY